MIIRLVKMTFKEEFLPQFHELFALQKSKIRNTPGCLHLELLKDARDERIRYTYSLWDSEDSLNEYRNSAFFREIWPATKSYFDAAPQAFSMLKLEDVPAFVEDK